MFFYVKNKSAILGSLCIASRTNNDIVKFWDDLLNDAEIIHNENLRFGSVFDYAKWKNSEKGTSEVGKTVEFSVTTNSNGVEIAKVVFVHSMK